MQHFRRIAIVSALIALVASCAAIPAAAFGNGGSGAGAGSVSQAVLQARAAVAATNDHARRSAPLERNGRCMEKVHVKGLGNTCRTKRGLLRVQMDDGSSFTTHGSDAPPLSTDAPYLPGSAASLESPSTSDIACVSQSSRHVMLVYARPAGSADRYGTVAPSLRREALKMSAFLDAESRSVDATAAKRVRFACDSSGQPLIKRVTTRALGGGGATFSDIVDDLAAAGLAHWSSSSAIARYAVYFDAPAASGAAGTGHFYGDDSTGTGNLANKGGTYAVEYRWAGGGGLPHWNLMLHELGHTMGAVNSTSANSTGASHCNDDADVMCYDDGGARANYRSGVCSTEQFDCNRNDYFNPRPAAGSYLATHWNVASPANLFLEHRSVSGTTTTRLPQGGTTTSVDSRRPTMPRFPRAGFRGLRAVGVRWSASGDNVAVHRYHIYRFNGRRYVKVRSVGARARTVGIFRLRPGTAYRFRVRAADRAGNLSRFSAIIRTSTKPTRAQRIARAKRAARMRAARARS